MKYLLLLLITLFASGACIAQKSEESAVIAVIQKLFDGIGSKDTIVIKSVFMEDGQNRVVEEKEGTINISNFSTRDFIENISKANSDLEEKMGKPQVLIADNIATAWVPYEFHRDGSFHHCGIDAFHMIKTNRGWKVSSVVYSRKTENCDESLNVEK